MRERIPDIGCRRELLVDDFLIGELCVGAHWQLHPPVAREPALVTDRPWEGNMCLYVTVFEDGGRYRMYYRTGQFNEDRSSTLGQPFRTVVCCAESSDGVHWERPELGLCEFAGSKANNIVWTGGGGKGGPGTQDFSPFRDANPACDPEARYKAVGAAPGWPCPGLFAAGSPDGLNWQPLGDKAIISAGAFDTQNIAFWDAERDEYRAYVRDLVDGRRDIRTCTSQDFVGWTTPQWLEYPGAASEQLYTNQVIPYYRAPHLFVGFPTRYVERPWSPAIESLPELQHRRLRAEFHERYGTALTDGLFMSSRDGRSFRRWGEAFIRPGPQREGNWVYGDNYQCWGMLETESGRGGCPPELSFYVSEHYWRGHCTTFRRYTLRLDGFVSVQAPLAGGAFVTKPLTFQGQALHLNMATSAAGSVKVEILTAEGEPVPGFALDECWEVIGDEVDRRVLWKGGGDLGALAGTPVRLRFALVDADLYALRFRP